MKGGGFRESDKAETDQGSGRMNASRIVKWMQLELPSSIRADLRSKVMDLN